MIRVINGVRYSITSPSLWEVDGFPIYIDFLGDQWSLCCPGSDGEPCFSYFSKLSQAQSLIELAFAPVQP